MFVTSTEEMLVQRLSRAGNLNAERGFANGKLGLNLQTLRRGFHTLSD